MLRLSTDSFFLCDQSRLIASSSCCPFGFSWKAEGGKCAKVLWGLAWQQVKSVRDWRAFKIYLPCQLSSFCCLHKKEAGNRQHININYELFHVNYQSSAQIPTYTASQHVVHKCTKTPPIHCFAMTTACQNLWSP